MRILDPLLRLPRWLLTALCVAAILYLTLAPHPLPDNDISFWEHTDKIVHAIMFGGLYFCAWFDIWRNKKAPLNLRLLLATGVTLFGGVIELLQRAMQQGRGAEWADLAADAAGALLGALIF
ncbi:MAG: VanZ family protein [Muribaculaceae bacterium]|nr:VanZ family protein [Muribaculaceae bacterium]